MSFLFPNPLAVLEKLPTPTEVVSGLMQVPRVLSDRELFAAHVSYRLAQAVALAVRQTARQAAQLSDATSASAHKFSGKIVDVRLPIMGQLHTLRWQVDAEDILSAQRVEPEPDARTLTASPANVTLTVMNSVYDELWDQWPPDMERIMHHVHISGESALANWVSDLTKNLRPDVWAQLVDIIGATPAGWVQWGAQRAQQDLQSFGQMAQARFLDGLDGLDGADNSNNTAVAIRHERLQSLSTQIMNVRVGVDALAQRIARLQQRHSRAANTGLHP